MTQLRLLPGEKTLAAAAMRKDEGHDYHSGIYILDSATGNLTSERLSEGIGSNVAASVTEPLVFYSHSEGSIEALSLPDLSVTRTLAEARKEGSGRVCAIEVFPDGKHLLVGDSKGKLIKLKL